MGDRPGNGNRPGGGNWWNDRPTNRPGNRPWNRPDRDINIDIDNNFKNSWNFTQNRGYWGGRPWWNHGYHGGWHHGCWSYGWGRPPGWHFHYHYHSPWGYWDSSDAWKAVGWGLVGWSLGNLIFNSGYSSYSNPYQNNTTVVYQTAPQPTQPVYQVNYSEPMTVAAQSAQEVLDKMPEEKQAELADKALAELDAARTAFKAKDFMTALGKAETAVSYDPGDSVLHEFRALCLFALGKYSDAAIILNAVLAAGPGFGWDTMIDLYDSSATYEGQLRKLETYAKGNVKAADARFVLGYHYMTAGHLKEATAAFKQASELQPADEVAKQLYELCKSSTDGDPEDAPAETLEEETEEDSEYPAPKMEQLAGAWVADKGDGREIALSIDSENQFVWTFKNGDETQELKGTASIQDGLLVLATEDSQLVGATTLSDEDKKMKFLLAGGPDGDPGLDFVKKG